MVLTCNEKYNWGQLRPEENRTLCEKTCFVSKSDDNDFTSKTISKFIRLEAIPVQCSIFQDNKNPIVLAAFSHRYLFEQSMDLHETSNRPQGSNVCINPSCKIGWCTQLLWKW